MNGWIAIAVTLACAAGVPALIACAFALQRIATAMERKMRFQYREDWETRSD